MVGGGQTDVCEGFSRICLIDCDGLLYCGILIDKAFAVLICGDALLFLLNTDRALYFCHVSG